MTLETSHFDISGIDSNLEQSLKNELKAFTLLIFHLDISGNEIKEVHLLKIPYISIKYNIKIFH